jgi:hypothetical protein
MNTTDVRSCAGATERQRQVMRTFIASSGLLPGNRLDAQDRHAALFAEAEWDRLAQQGGPRSTHRVTGAAWSYRWMTHMLIQLRHRLTGSQDGAPPQTPTLDRPRIIS